jgi:hypothetical protein
MWNQFDRDFYFVTPNDWPDLIKLSLEVSQLTWPEFMRHNEPANKYWSELYDRFADFQLGLIESESNNLIATANSIPLAWDSDPLGLPDEGWEWAVRKGFSDAELGLVPKVSSALVIAILPAYRDRGLSTPIIQKMKAIAGEKNLKALIAPVRPYLKSRYPLTPFERYVTWKNTDGEPFDPWIRVHANEGAEIVKICPKSFLVTGTVDEWEDWTAMEFPESGSYVVHGALNPIVIDIDQNRGTYLEPNIWMYHPL